MGFARAFVVSVSMRFDFDLIPESPENRMSGSRLLARLHRDIGLAAVAAELNLPAQEFGFDIEEAIERGAVYLTKERSPALAS